MVSGHCNSVNYLGHSKMLADDDDDDDDDDAKFSQDLTHQEH